MRFEFPKLLWLLMLVVPGLIAFFWWAGRQRKRLMDQFVNPRLLGQLLSASVKSKYRVPLVLASRSSPVPNEPLFVQVVGEVESKIAGTPVPFCKMVES